MGGSVKSYITYAMRVVVSGRLIRSVAIIIFHQVLLPS